MRKSKCGCNLWTNTTYRFLTAVGYLPLFFNVAYTWWIKTDFLPCRRRRPAPACVSHKATGGHWGGWGRILSRLQDLHKITSEWVEVMLTQRKNVWNKKCITKNDVNVINDLPVYVHFDLIGFYICLSRMTRVMEKTSYTESDTKMATRVVSVTCLS